MCEFYLRFRLHSLALVATLIAAIMLPAGTAGATSAKSTGPTLGGFSLRPAEFNPAVPSTRAYFQPTIRAGGTFRGKVILSNSQLTPLRLRVYPVDGLTGTTSGAVYGDRQDRLRKAGAWLRPAVAAVTVPSRQRRLVAFTVRVPAGTPAGEQLAGIAVEAMHPPRTGGSFRITEVFRVVVGVEIRVPGPVHRALRLTGIALRALPGTHVASAVIGVANRGTLLCKPRLTVVIQGAGRARTATRQLDTILPGDAIPYAIPWSASLATGSYSVSARATGCGAPVSLSKSVRVAGRLHGTVSSTSPQPPRVQRSATPWWTFALVGLGGLIAGLILHFALYLRGRGTRRSRRDSAGGEIHPCAEPGQ